MTKHGGPRPGAGAPTKASRGQRRAKNLHVTIPHELWLKLVDLKPEDQKLSPFVAELLRSEIDRRNMV